MRLHLYYLLMLISEAELHLVDLLIFGPHRSLHALSNESLDVIGIPPNQLHVLLVLISLLLRIEIELSHFLELVLKVLSCFERDL